MADEVGTDGGTLRNAPKRNPGKFDRSPEFLNREMKSSILAGRMKMGGGDLGQSRTNSVDQTKGKSGEVIWGGMSSMGIPDYTVGDLAEEKIK